MSTQELSPILVEYDELLNSLQDQIHVYKTEHGLLRNEMLKLLSHNEELRKFVDVEFQQSLQNNVWHNTNTVNNSEMIKNLRQQLQLSLQERKHLSDMLDANKNQVSFLKQQIAETSVKKIEKNKDPTVSTLESKLESLSLQLRMERVAREDEENLRLKNQTEAAKLRILLDNQVEKTQKLEDIQRELKEHLKTAEQEKALTCATLECVTQSRDALEDALTTAEQRVQGLRIKSEEAKAKVEEAVEIAERAVYERDDALQRETKLLEEVERIRPITDHVIDEASRRVGEEVNKVKESLNGQITELLKELDKKRDEVQSLTRKIETLKKNHKNLEMILQNETITDEQVNSLNEEIVQLQSHLEHNQKLLTDMKLALSEVLTENENLVRGIDETSGREKELYEQVMDLKLQIKNCRCTLLKDRLKNIKVIKIQQTTELERQVQTQLALNEKLQKESERIASVLQEKLERAAKVNEKLKLRKKNVVQKLKEVKKSS